eukprot:c25573_g5_i1 orf=356-925(+)
MAGYDGATGIGERRIDEAILAVEVMEQRGIPISSSMIHCLLKVCAAKKDLEAVKRVHSLMVRSGLDSSAVLVDHLIRLFASCGGLLEANQVFCKVAKPSVHTWSAIISANASLGQSERALELYHKMRQSSVKRNKYVYSSILKACTKMTDLPSGKLIHGQIIESGLNSDMVLGNALVDMYAKCGNLEET